MRKRIQRTSGFLLGALLGLASAAPALAENGALEPQEIRDLRYGQVLYHLYQQKYFSAITDLLVARKTRPVSAQGEDPQLLLGALYLSYGMHRRAGDVFDEVLEDRSMPAVHDRAWYYIAKLRYRNGHVEDAEAALRRIKDTLPADREAERLNLLANTYLERGRYDEAIAVLERFEHDSAWQTYARFNLGVALIRAGRPEQGVQVLQALGRMELQGGDEELRALRDKANLAMGFASIGDDRPDAAIEQFSRVRLQGPLSNKALLGLGWARNLNEDYEGSLIPWLELQGRADFDAAVQEALLAIPYTFEKLDNKRLALDHYKQAIRHFAAQLNSLQQAIEAVNNGELIKAMRPANLNDETSLPRHAFELPDTIAAPYLSELMASNGFQQAYNNYQDLLFLRETLRHWRKQLPAYELMLAERQKAYRQRLPRVAGDERLDEIRRLQARRDELAAQIARIERDNDAFALATEDELPNVELIQEVGAGLQGLRQQLENSARLTDPAARLEVKKSLTEAENNYAFLRGILYWQLQQDFVPRLWQAKQSLKQLDIALDRAVEARRSLARSANHAPQRFERHQQTIQAKRAQINRTLNRLERIIEQHATQIQRLALQQLHTRQRQLENYHVRARFSMARLLDTLAKEQELSRAR